MRRVYREDDMAMENWTSILSRVPLDNPIVPETATNLARMDGEYLRAVLTPNASYCVDHSVLARQEDGTDRQMDIRDYFRVINVAAGAHKTHMVHTFETADDPRAYKPYTIELQRLSRWRPAPGEDTDGLVRVYGEGDPEWIVPTTLAPLAALASNLWRFAVAAPDPERPSVLVLSDPQRAKPPMPLTDWTIPRIV